MENCPYNSNLQKSGAKTCKTNYRPISLLPTLSKIFESVLHDRLLKHCLENKVITEKQAAYLKGDSTVSQLLYIVHNIQQNWANRKITHGVFLDVSSAFDKVWHNGLIDRTINDSVEKSNLFNKFFASKATVKNYNDAPPHLDPLEDISYLRSVNTSPIEIAKLVRNIKKSHHSYCV